MVLFSKSSARSAVVVAEKLLLLKVRDRFNLIDPQVLRNNTPTDIIICRSIVARPFKKKDVQQWKG